MTLAALGRRATKAAALPAGLLTRRRPGDIVILLYHRVGAGDREIDLTVSSFERQLSYLAERELAVSLDDALAGRRGGVVVTFDDGYRDFSDHVVPLLLRYKVPGLLYLATGLITSKPDPDRLRWADLQQAAATGLVKIGSHTHSHVNLVTADHSVARDEMCRSKELIEDHLDQECRHFAYPWGVASEQADRAARAIFESAALRAWKTNRAGHIDPHALGRTPVLASDGDTFFRAKVRGALDAEQVFYRALKRGPWRFQ